MSKSTNDRLLSIFEKSKISAYKLQQQTGVSYSQLSRWRRGETVISIEIADKIAAALGRKIELVIR